MNVAMIWVMKTEGRKGVRPLIFRMRELGGQKYTSLFWRVFGGSSYSCYSKAEWLSTVKLHWEMLSSFCTENVNVRLRSFRQTGLLFLLSLLGILPWGTNLSPVHRFKESTKIMAFIELTIFTLRLVKLSLLKFGAYPREAQIKKRKRKKKKEDRSKGGLYLMWKVKTLR